MSVLSPKKSETYYLQRVSALERKVQELETEVRDLKLEKTDILSHASRLRFSLQRARENGKRYSVGR